VATLGEIEDAIRVADKAGRKSDVVALAKERERLLAEQPTSTIGKGFQTVDDLFRISADTMTRGGLDKVLDTTPFYGSEQEKTRASRERVSDWVEAPLDVASAVIASPYRIGSTLAGAGFGGLEGAVSTYMHQPNWVPSLSEAGDIATGAGTGALAGAGGAKLGEWGGKAYSKLAGRDVPNTAPPGVLSKVGTAVEPAAKMSLPTVAAAEYLMSHAGLPGVVTGIKTGAKALNWLGNTRFANPQTMSDPATVGVARDALAKLLISRENKRGY
jgi:hypothetical protein